ncbi:molybdopterin-guanine dinucleotide biosynthesis protein B [Sutterella megalosphaeroides]|uniref:Molybdopterin-guanine dinucleotide biosynthesis protein B (MobB) domain-containing protein n=1 Tax=Sutterella megalosphaeroides TaxID=2494234 RepID=A0A2Z6IBR3_9BURK|nr:molybdopterin-guanine dinucleotide biosynthesis protein B [Sutterella megalosphaeroides]BBF24025.1 hypothetical protein SUTMEG_19160 [Sutterella megalosphaeroides]
MTQSADLKTVTRCAPRTPPFAVGFVGFSGAGKTTLATRVASILAARGLKVSALKDAHHGVDLDKPGKDTYRYREAGAAEVILRTAERYAILVETPETVSLDELLARVRPDADMVVVEGFKHEGDFPKIELLRGEAADAVASGRRTPLYPTDERIVAVAVDRPFTPVREAVDVLDANDPQAVADYCLKLRAAREAR